MVIDRVRKGGVSDLGTEGNWIRLKSVKGIVK